MTNRKKLIEVALPLETISDASAREKYISVGHPSTLHLWWARRPLAACRAVIFASLVDDPDSPSAPSRFVEACWDLPRGRNAAETDTARQRLFDFIETLVQWESTTDDQVLETARELIRLSTEGEPPTVADPFAGGGSIPLEAQRLGLKTHAGDLNPVAVTINKAMIEIPPRFADLPPVNPRDRGKMGGKTGWSGAAGLVADVRYYGEWMRERAAESIGQFYPECNEETVIAWLWTRTVQCPNPACGATMPLVRSFDLSRKKGKRAWVEPRYSPETRQFTFVVHQGKRTGPKGTVDRRGATCIACDTPVEFDYIREEGRAGRMGAQLMAIVTEGRKGRNYYSPNPRHEEVADLPIPETAPATDMPEKALGFRVQVYGMTKHRDLFSPRQLVALTTLSDLVDAARRQVCHDALEAGLPEDDAPLRANGTGASAYAEAVSVYLGMNVSRQANRLSTICFWDTHGEKVQQVFARQAIPMTWDYAEANPFSNSSGNFLGQLDYLARALETLRWKAKGTATQINAATTQYPRLVSTVFATDPRYYDNIGYADLSDFFYVWLRRSLRKVYPDVFETLLVPKASELVAVPYRFDDDAQTAVEHFERGLRQAFTNMREAAHPDYPLTAFYAFKQSEVVPDQDEDGSLSFASTGWETMLEGLIQAGFSVSGTWPMRTEATKNLKKNVNALASSIVLVCRPRPEAAPMASRRDFVRALRNELPTALREMQSGNIAPVDLAQASVGPGMAVYSRYRKVLEPNGDRLTVRTALQLINRELDAYLAEQEGYIDEYSRFAVAWFEQFGFEEGPFGQADVLARAKNSSVEGLARAGVLQSGAGKVCLYRWDELDPGWDPEKDERLTVWEATHHLIERLNAHGEEGAARLLARLPSDVAAQARQLAYRLYNICERKDWPQHARDYNALVVSWSASQEQAQDFRQYQQGELL